MIQKYPLVFLESELGSACLDDMTLISEDPGEVLEDIDHIQSQFSVYGSTTKSRQCEAFLQDFSTSERSYIHWRFDSKLSGCLEMKTPSWRPELPMRTTENTIRGNVNFLDEM